MSKAVVIAALVGSLGLSGATAAPSATPSAGSSARIHGQILHPAGKVVSVQLRGHKAVEAPVDAKGAFSLTVPLTEAGAAKLTTGNEYTDLWLAPDDDLTLSLDAARFDETVKYAGRGARVNNLLADEVRSALISDVRSGAAFGRSAAGFAAFADSMKAVRLQRLAAAFKGVTATPAEAAFRAYRQQEVAYDWANLRLSYGSEKKLPMADPYYQFMTAPDVPLDNPAALGVEAYPQYVSFVLATATESAGASSMLAALKLGRQRLSAPVQRALLPGLAIDAVRESPLTVADSARIYALANLDLKPEARKQIEASWAARQLTRAGAPAPDLHAVSADGKAFDWASLRGKVVFLDFWASWCGPCIGEMPAAKKLHAALHDRAADVVFLNVSIDGQAANWLKGITKHGVEGQNVHSGGDWESPAIKAYGLASIPRYMIIGRDGQILDPDAPRPSGGAEVAIRAALAAK